LFESVSVLDLNKLILEERGVGAALRPIPLGVKVPELPTPLVDEPDNGRLD